MLKLICKRFLDALWVLLLLCMLTFFLIRFVPGGPFDNECGLPIDTLRALEKFYGYDQPLTHQFFHYLKHLLQGDFGPSMRYPGYSVSQLLQERIPVSFELGGLTLLLSLGIGLACGGTAALFHNRWIDKLLMSICFVSLSLPTFVLGPILVFIFSLYFGWFPAIGWDSYSNYILPTITLACMYSGYIARIFRASCLDVLDQPFIRTAFAKGLSKKRVFFIHVLKNAFMPVLTYLGPTAAAVMSGSLVIESLFQIPGAGSLFISAVVQRDTPLLLGTVLYFSLLILLFNFFVDVILAICNPKQKISL